MRYILISFKVRNSVYSFANFLKRKNIPVAIINTPRNISSSCGLSIKIPLQNYQHLVNIIKSNNISNLIGIFIVEKSGMQEKFEKIF